MSEPIKPTLYESFGELAKAANGRLDGVDAAAYVAKARGYDAESGPIPYEALPKDCKPEELDTVSIGPVNLVYLEYMSPGTIIIDFMRGEQQVRLTLWTKKGARILGRVEPNP